MRSCDDEYVRWEIVGEARDAGDVWVWQLRRRRRLHAVRVLKQRRSEEELADKGLSLVESHLDDHQPPDIVSFSAGWDFETQTPVEGAMGFAQVRGVRGRWLDLAQRLHLPHWLQPHP